MKDILDRLVNDQTLSRNEARTTLTGLARGRYNNSQMASFLTVYLMRSIRLEELEGFRDAMLELCRPVYLDDYPVIDLCGTGGDGKNTFNISTVASFVVAGAGVPVAKHGNYSVSSISGSSDVLSYLGCRFSAKSDAIKHSIDKAQIGYIHAPLFHPAMKSVVSIRKELGVKTFFNMLGPLVNPASPPHQLIGVFNLELVRLYGYLYQHTDKNFAIVHTLDGHDEISLTDNFKALSNNSEDLLTPASTGLLPLEPEELYGGKNIKEAARIFYQILDNEGTEAQENAVLANAGMALAVARKKSLKEGIEEATTSLKREHALRCFKKFLALNS